jgi:hypothetical protein
MDSIGELAEFNSPGGQFFLAHELGHGKHNGAFATAPASFDSLHPFRI